MDILTVLSMNEMLAGMSLVMVVVMIVVVVVVELAKHFAKHHGVRTAPQWLVAVAVVVASSTQKATHTVSGHAHELTKTYSGSQNGGTSFWIQQSLSICNGKGAFQSNKR